MNKTVRTLFVAILAVVFFSCSKNSNSSTVAAASTNQATLDGAVTDFSRVTTATKSSDSKTITISGTGTSTTGTTTATNNLNLSVKSKAALKIGSYSSSDTTTNISLSLSVAGKYYGQPSNATVTISRLDTIVAGSYSATVYDTSFHSKAISGNFFSKF